MCIAIAKNIGVDVPSEETLRHCWDNNPDGAGFAFAHEGNVFIKKGFMTWDNFINSFKFWDNKINFKNKGLLIHFRIATHGGTNASMTHPFPIETDEGALSKPEYITNYAVVHNGIISLTSSKASRTQGISDTAIFIRDYLSLIAKNKRWFNNPNNIELIEKLIDSKMAILDRYGNIKMTSGFDADNGVFYSNKTYQDNYYRKSARTTYWSDAYEDYDYYSKHTSYKNSANITSYDYSTGAYQSSKYIPLMRVKVGDTIEYDGGSESITRAEECLYYITEDNLIFYRYPCMDEEFANEENFPANTKVAIEWAMSVVDKDGNTTNYSQEMMFKYYKEQNSGYEPLYSSEEEAQAAIDGYVATLGITDDDTVYEKSSFIMQPQASMVIEDQKTGEVVAMIGGRGEKTANKTLNRVTNALRNPGSTFKIVAAYAPAFEELGYGPGTVQYDGPFAYTENGKVGRLVNNWDKKTQYRGWTTLREAIARSMNIVAVKTITDVTPSVAIDYLLRFGFTSLQLDGANSDAGQAMALGGLTNGVSNLELTAAYAGIANGGSYYKPKLYSKIVDNEGNVILDNTVEEPTQVISEQNAWLLIDCMKDVVTGAGGTSSAAKISNMTTAGKSGTTSENRDVWFVGMSPYYTAGIWVGYDNNGYKHELSSKAGETSFHKKLWSKVMSRIHQNLENKDFDKPSGIVQVTICTKSGKLAIPGVCDSDGRSGIVINEYFADGTQPTETCDKHVLANICADTGLLATTMCPNQIVQSKVLLPPMQSGVAEAVTLDTAYGISSNLQAATCTVHTGGVYLPSIYEQTGSAAGAVTPTDPNAAAADPNAATADPNAAAAADPAAGDGTAGSAAGQ